MLWLETSDGEKYTFDDRAGRILLSSQGFGMPPIDYTTQRHIQQQGESVKRWNLGSRRIQIGLMSIYSDRGALFDGRRDLIGFLNPFRGKAKLKLEIKGITWHIEVMYEADFGMSSAQQPQSNAQGAVIRLIAHDPTWKKDTMTVAEASLTSLQNLQFSFMFPFAFGSSLTNIWQVTNSGHLEAKPTITLRGPLQDVVIKNLTDEDKELKLETYLEPRQIATIYTDWDILRVDGPSGVNWTGYLSENSSLVDFRLLPPWAIEDGVNYVLVYSTVSNSDSRITMEYWERYLGI